jgi:hypothetical protein
VVPSFVAPLAFDTGALPRSVVLGDFNGDGFQDIAIANGGDATVSVLLNNGDGSFRAAPSLITGNGPVSVAVGDFNGDGILDLVVVNAGVGRNTASVFLGNGDGSFQAPRSYNPGSGPDFVAVGDFNRDGNLDLAVSDSGSASVSVLLGNGDGSFQAPRLTSVAKDTGSLTVGDFNGDGVPDFVVGDYALSGGAFNVLLGNGDGSFPSPTLGVR